jgi:1-acyl-sn-glycerol-3-phosphate acyltransferase
MSTSSGRTRKRTTTTPSNDRPSEETVGRSAPTAGPGTKAHPEPQDPLGRFISRRVSAAMFSDGPNERFMRTVQSPVWDFLCDHYFRLEIDGWHRIPDETSLLIGIHSGGSLTMDAWTLIHAWYRQFEGRRILHGTAHDVLMAAPGLGDYFKALGVIPASRQGVTAALASGHDVVVWPGGEQDAMRNWRKRDQAVLAGRKGFVRQAIRSGVPIVPVATIGGHDTVFVLSEGRFIARWTGLGKRLRGATIPIIAGFPFPLAIEILPAHLPLPAKIRTELLDPIEVDHDPERVADKAYVEKIYNQVERAIQDGMDRLAKRRSFPIFG